MSQAPVMSLYLADQKLGSHSNADSSSHKFMLKGRQTGGVHRGHAWVFRAESHDTMLAWYEDIKNLTEKTGEERTAFIRQHARSVSAGSNKAASVSDDGALDEDEADQVPYSATASQIDEPYEEEKRVERPVPGGRFPSALTIDRNSQVPPSPSASSSGDRDTVTAAGALPSEGLIPLGEPGQQGLKTDGETNAKGEVDSFSRSAPQGYTALPLNPGPGPVIPKPQQNTYTPIAYPREYNAKPNLAPSETAGSEYHTKPEQAGDFGFDAPGAVPHGGRQPEYSGIAPRSLIPRHDSKYGDWMAPAAAGVGGVAIGTSGMAAYKHHEDRKEAEQKALADHQRYQDLKAHTEKTKNESQSNPPSLDYPSQILPESIPPAELSPQYISPAEVSPQPIPPSPAAAGISPNPPSTQPFPPNVIWAPKSASVIDPSRIHHVDNNTSAFASNQGLSSSAGPGLDASSEQSSNLEGGKKRDPAAPIRALARPEFQSHVSVSTISDLHIPGEFPRAKAGAERTGDRL